MVALHCAAYLLYADASVGGGRGNVLVVGPHRPYLDYVSDVLPSLGEQGVQTVTISDLVPEGSFAVPETDPRLARLKGTAEIVGAIEPAIRLYEEPPSEGMLVETNLFDVNVSPDDWSEAFQAADPALAHNVARDDIWNELTAILAAKVEDEGVSADAAGKVLRRSKELARAMTRAWPLIDPTDLVGDLWEVPAYLRMCAPWLTSYEVALMQRPQPHTWTVADLPLLDAAHRRLGDPETPRRRRRQEATAAAERAGMDFVIDQTPPR